MNYTISFNRQQVSLEAADPLEAFDKAILEHGAAGPVALTDDRGARVYLLAPTGKTSARKRGERQSRPQPFDPPTEDSLPEEIQAFLDGLGKVAT